MTARLYDRLKAACPAEWEAYVRHPFVEGMKDGTLPREAFLRYLRQDYLFLIHFARAWALACVKTDRIVEMRLCAATVHALIDEEMRLHVATCAAEGISEDELARLDEEPETLAYTRFVTDAGLRGDLLDLLAALAPCVLGYGEIGRRLAAETGGPAEGHPYRDWIAAYAGDQYQQACDRVEELIGTVAARLAGDAASSPRWPDLARTFRTATRLEADFWEMGMKAARQPVMA